MPKRFERHFVPRVSGTSRLSYSPRPTVLSSSGPQKSTTRPAPPRPSRTPVTPLTSSTPECCANVSASVWLYRPLSTFLFSRRAHAAPIQRCSHPRVELPNKALKPLKADGRASSPPAAPRFPNVAAASRRYVSQSSGIGMRKGKTLPARELPTRAHILSVLVFEFPLGCSRRASERNTLSCYANRRMTVDAIRLGCKVNSNKTDILSSQLGQLASHSPLTFVAHPTVLPAHRAVGLSSKSREQR